MKNLLIILGSVSLGYALNTETGKQVRKWVIQKAQNQIDNLVGKINEVTIDSSVEEKNKD